MGFRKVGAIDADDESVDAQYQSDQRKHHAGGSGRSPAQHHGDNAADERQQRDHCEDRERHVSSSSAQAIRPRTTTSPTTTTPTTIMRP